MINNNDTLSAEFIRANPLAKGIIPERERKYLSQADITEQWVDNTDGEKTHVFFIKPKAERKDAEAYPLYVNIHGGGFMRGHTEDSLIFSAKLSVELQCMVIDIDYKLAPEYPYPTAFHECYDIVQWAFDHAEKLGIDKKRIALGGHSSGGNLSAAICLRMKKESSNKVVLQILDYPPLDLATDPADKPEADHTLIPPEIAKAYNAFYAKAEAAQRDMYISPVLASKEDLKDLPKALILTAGNDNLRFEAETYWKMLKEAGVDAEYHCISDSGHGFVIKCTGNYQIAHQMIIETLRSVFDVKM